MSPNRFQRLAAALLLPLYLNLALPIAPGLWAASVPTDRIGQDFTNPGLLPPAELIPLVRTPASVAVNRQAPPVTPPDFTVRFSTQPTVNEIKAVRIFRESLQPLTDDSSTEELQELAAAIAAYAARSATNDVSALEAFLKKHPRSAWRVSLLTNMGLGYFDSGYFSKAFAAWEEAWDGARKAKGKGSRRIAGRALGELLSLNARVGRMQRMGELFADVEGEEFEGAITEKIRNVRDGLTVMKTQPQIAFKCGPYAVSSVLNRLDLASTEKAVKIREFPSTTEGTSLGQIAGLARDVGLSYQPARRQPGAAIPVPVVVHWSVGHFAAIVAEPEPGRYLVKDPTFGLDLVVAGDAIDQESSGYFLIPAGPLPAGWTAVEEKEADRVFGRGQLTNRTENKLGQNQPTVAPKNDCHGMPVYNVHAMLTSLTVNDIPVGYQPPVGPGVDFQLTHLQRDSKLTGLTGFANIGDKWAHNWLAFVEVGSGQADVFLRGGGVDAFLNFNSTTNQYDIQSESRCLLARVMQGANTTYEKSAPDGSKEVYAQFDGSNRYFLTKVVDPYGNQVTVAYDGSLRLSSITDALGQVTTFAYENADPKKITKVTDPFGRAATFGYRSDGLLERITDTVGLASTFTYEATGRKYMTAMTTPYGTTAFAYNPDPNDPSAYIEVTLPDGSKERTWFKVTAASTAASEASVPSSGYAFNNYLQYRNTFFWGRKAYYESMQASGTLEESKAVIYHWLHYGSLVGPILESVKHPGETRVWFTHEGQPNLIDMDADTRAAPSAVARMVEDPETGALVEQVSLSEYNSRGLVTKSTDPLGRETKLEYDSSTGLDLLAVKQKTGTSTYDTLATYVYNGPPHLPTSITDAAGQATAVTYNSAGQVSTVTNAKSEITKFYYDPAKNTASRNLALTGYLVAIDGPLSGTSDTVVVSYDGFGRPRTITDTDGYAVTTDYDNLDRPTVVSYPDGTYEQLAYPKLEAEWMRDRLGRWTQVGYNSLRQVSFVQDAMQRLTSYVWCYCGSLQQLTDPMGRVTGWTYNYAGQLTKKTYPGTAQAPSKEVNYAYDQAGRLKDMTDALNQKTTWKYFKDGSLKRVEYSNAVNATSNVSYTYDSLYQRPATMTDGTGTTAYGYNPVPTTPTLGAGRLASIDGPLANDTIGYTYDELGRTLTRTINGSANSVALQYDAAGRVGQVVNGLGTFGYGYVNATGRLDHIDYPNAQRTNFAYHGNTGDNRLQQIQNLRTTGGANLSTFGYTYDAVGVIKTWSQQADTSVAQTYTFGYDLADQLRTALLKNAGGAGVHAYNYTYDDAGNRTSDQADATPRTFTNNHLNQVTAQSAGGPVRFSGSVTKLGTVTVAGQAAQMAPGNQFSADVTLSPGTQTVPIVATDTAGQNRTQNYSLTVGNAGSRTLAYDGNGNMTDNGAGQAYLWDAADRLVKITYTGGATTEFTYDGLGRRTKIVEKNSGGTATSDKRFVWEGLSLSEERDSSNTVTKKFFAQGQLNGSTKYFYTTDHLGSIREVVDNSGIVQARYDYDPYGKTTKVSGSIDSDFLYTGHYFHVASSLHLAPFRAYDASLGRWLNRDPIAEHGGTNLYAYVEGNVINHIDPLGLDALDTAANFAAGFGDFVSFGLTKKVRQNFGWDDGINKCGGAYGAGQWAGFAAGLAMGGVHAGRTAVAQMGNAGSLATRLGRGIGRLFYDNRSWGAVRSTYSQYVGGLKPISQSLHHAFAPQRANGVYQGVRNAGLNYFQISAKNNSWMNGSTTFRLVVEYAFKAAGAAAITAEASVFRGPPSTPK